MRYAAGSSDTIELSVPMYVYKYMMLLALRCRAPKAGFQLIILFDGSGAGDALPAQTARLVPLAASFLVFHLRDMSWRVHAWTPYGAADRIFGGALCPEKR